MESAKIRPLSLELETIDEVDECEWLAEPAEVRMFDGIDQRKEYRAPLDCGWIGEDADGIWLMRHPEAVLAERPELWWTVHQWQMGQREPIDGLSNHETEQLATMCGAYGREQERRHKRGNEDP